MEQKLNIAEILKNKPRGTKLYSMIHGKCSFEAVTDEIFKINFCTSKFGLTQSGECTLIKFGNMYDGGECIIFPSKSMRDWRKFAWKKGDLLINSCGFQCIFKEWASDDYTKFNGCYSNSRDGYEDVSNAETANFVKLDNNTTYEYVKEIERKLGGILNLETLEIEKTQPEFKDGDIVVAEEDNYYDRVIFIAAIKDVIVSKALINVRYEDYEVYYNEYRFGHNRNLRLATDSEKKQLFSALAKEDKRWDSDKKAIVDLKQKCEFKPFDRCIWKIRNCEGSIWQASFVSYVDEYGASPMGMSIDEDLVNLIILPYNDKTKLLVGTTDDWKGGEQ